jgi:hypothetical protein
MRLYLLYLSSECSLFSSDTVDSYSFFGVRDPVSHPYKTAGKLTVLQVLTFKILDRRYDDKIRNTSKTEYVQNIAKILLEEFFVHFEVYSTRGRRRRKQCRLFKTKLLVPLPEAL